ncbi:MAG: glycosyl transferase family 1 [Dehalococcoidales bacterium]|jgi:D-inositol-3-phosphate glycosyltransferase|nr:glycosyl transferase family 1 [Dehalococcoidales bacterium]MDP6448759.1 glycosyltransferase [Dehalococcoidales bacterium]MDP6825187.1 glycosyltransferase [Dehalococcoidales bacterium]|tara:strand:- start:75 stop:1310 length:1236 start_codon:yes stop_codon:yes gene_type:complete
MNPITGGQMRIAMLSVHSCPVGRLGTKDTGGMSVYVLELARELGKSGHLVDIYTRVHDSEDRQIYELGRNVRLMHLKAGKGGEIHKLAVYAHLPEFTRELENFRQRTQFRYDLVYSHYWLSGLVGRQLCQWWDVPHLIMFHTLGVVKNTIGIGEIEPELRIETERELVKDCQRIIAATEKEKSDLIGHYGASPEAVHVIPCGVNLELFRPVDRKEVRRQLGFDGDGKNILYVGRIEPLKGLDKLLKAMTYLKNKPGIRLLVIGGDENNQCEINRLKQLSRELQIQGLVFFLGLIKQSELPFYYGAADVCVVPSYYESFGLVAMEALACGTPVVTTKVGYAENIIRQGRDGYVVMDNTPSTLSEKIARLLSRSNGDAKSVNARRATVTRFSWSKIAVRLARECETLRASHLR